MNSDGIIYRDTRWAIAGRQSPAHGYPQDPLICQLAFGMQMSIHPAISPEFQ
jgi:hypothetical protein